VYKQLGGKGVSAGCPRSSPAAAPPAHGTACAAGARHRARTWCTCLNDASLALAGLAVLPRRVLVWRGRFCHRESHIIIILYDIYLLRVVVHCVCCSCVCAMCNMCAGATVSIAGWLWLW
jgi:hypothetical protein